MLTPATHRADALAALEAAKRLPLRSEGRYAYLLEANAHATLALSAEPAEVVELTIVEAPAAEPVAEEKPKRATRTSTKKTEAAPAATPEETNA